MLVTISCSRARARASRDMTVPIGESVTAAISRYGSPFQFAKNECLAPLHRQLLQRLQQHRAISFSEHQ